MICDVISALIEQAYVCPFIYELDDNSYCDRCQAFQYHLRAMFDRLPPSEDSFEIRIKKLMEVK